MIASFRNYSYFFYPSNNKKGWRKLLRIWNNSVLKDQILISKYLRAHYFSHFSNILLQYQKSARNIGRINKYFFYVYGQNWPCMYNSVNWYKYWKAIIIIYMLPSSSFLPLKQKQLNKIERLFLDKSSMLLFTPIN